MHIRTLKIKNFRALEDVHVEFDRRVNVIVGPNAVGKTTVLEAIRLLKALLVPRTQQESTQTLNSLRVIRFQLLGCIRCTQLNGLLTRW